VHIRCFYKWSVCLKECVCRKTHRKYFCVYHLICDLHRPSSIVRTAVTMCWQRSQTRNTKLHSELWPGNLLQNDDFEDSDADQKKPFELVSRKWAVRPAGGYRILSTVGFYQRRLTFGSTTRKFKLRTATGNLRTWLRIFLIFLSPSRKILGKHFEIGHYHFLPTRSNKLWYIIILFSF
jgi:hypothetical protein